MSTGFLLVKTSPESAREVARDLAGIYGSSLLLVNGQGEREWDIFVQVDRPNVTAIGEEVRKVREMPPVQDTRTMIAYKIKGAIS